MKGNEIAKSLKIIGAIHALGGVILGFVILSRENTFSWLGFVVMVMSIVACMMFVGISEIINLQQENLKKQDEIIYLLKYNAVKEKTDCKTYTKQNTENL